MVAASQVDRTADLPVPRTPLIHRERGPPIMRELLLRDDLPLPTSTGSGVGKTRPALQVAADLSQVGRRP